jgi:hypothetical protein
MNSLSRRVLFIAIAAWAAYAASDTDAEFVSMGGCLLMGRDGKVIAVWDLPGAASADDALAQPDVVHAMQPLRPAESRIVRDW